LHINGKEPNREKRGMENHSVTRKKIPEISEKKKKRVQQIIPLAANKV